MIPGSLPSLVSGFVDYSAKKCNLRKTENFQDGNINAQNTVLFAILMIILFILVAFYFYVFLVLPWKISSSKGQSFMFKLFLIFAFIMFPVFNLGYLANYTRKTLE